MIALKGRVGDVARDLGDELCGNSEMQITHTALTYLQAGKSADTIFCALRADIPTEHSHVEHTKSASTQFPPMGDFFAGAFPSPMRFR